MKSSPEISKYRQTLHLEADRWDAKAAESASRMPVFGNSALAAQMAYCRKEAEKCRQALKQLSGRTKQQQRAGW